MASVAPTSVATAEPVSNCGAAAAASSSAGQPAQPASSVEGVCAAGCGQQAKQSCPTCLELKLAPTRFCSQECFKKSWKDHNTAVHKRTSQHTLSRAAPRTLESAHSPAARSAKSQRMPPLLRLLLITCVLALCVLLLFLCLQPRRSASTSVLLPLTTPALCGQLGSLPSASSLLTSSVPITPRPASHWARTKTPSTSTRLRRSRASGPPARSDEAPSTWPTPTASLESPPTRSIDSYTSSSSRTTPIRHRSTTDSSPNHAARQFTQLTPRSPLLFASNFSRQLWNTRKVFLLTLMTGRRPSLNTLMFEDKSYTAFSDSDSTARKTHSLLSFGIAESQVLIQS